MKIFPPPLAGSREEGNGRRTGQTTLSLSLSLSLARCAEREGRVAESRGGRAVYNRLANEHFAHTIFSALI